MKIKPLYLVTAIALLGLSIYFNYRQYSNTIADAKRIEVLANNTDKQSVIINRYIAPDSSNHVLVKTVFVKTDAEKELAISRTYVDSLRKALDVKTSQITELTTVKATAGAGFKATANTDSTTGYTRYHFGNKYLAFDLNTKDSTGNYLYFLHYTQTKYWKRNWLLGPKTYYTDLAFGDPNIIINKVQGFTQQNPKEKLFGLGLQAGYYYNFSSQKFTPSVGVGISYNLIRF